MCELPQQDLCEDACSLFKRTVKCEKTVKQPLTKTIVLMQYSTFPPQVVIFRFTLLLSV